MLFSSLEFLYIFLPLSVLLYFALPKSWRNGVLLALSIAFYAYGEMKLLWVMLFSVAINYLFGLIIVRVRAKRAALALAIALNLALLGYFKYADFFLENVGLSPLGVTLPLGISFYIFQAMSYVIDVYRGQVAVQKSPVAFGTYVMMFPQLVAGPIVRYSDVEGELADRKVRLSDISEGLRIFTVGLCKKVLLANRAGEIREIFLSAGEAHVSVLGEWVALVFYAFQIYYDFGGYSDMAVGLGRIFGFHFPRNFNYPYISRSITEFWRRWHITLSAWFKEYVYIPLGGNRCSLGRMYFNLSVTWLLTGIWHGAAWNFTLWGIYFFFILALEKAFLRRLLDRAPKAFGHIYALVFILFGWLIFTSEDGMGLARFGKLFGVGVGDFVNGFAAYEIIRHGVIMVVMAVGSTPFVAKLSERIRSRSETVWQIAINILVPLGVIVSTASLVGATYNPFLYFRF